MASVFDDDQALLWSRDLVEIRLDERRRRKQIVPPLNDVVGELEPGRGGGKVDRGSIQGRARRAHAVAARLHHLLALAVAAVNRPQAGDPARVPALHLLT